MGLKDAVDDVLKEWDILPHDRAFSMAEITDWLIRFMRPAIESMRKERDKQEAE